MNDVRLGFESAVISLSGGMDSTSLLLHLLARECRIHAVSFDYGQKHRLELERLQRSLDLLDQRGLPVSWHCIDLTSLAPLLHSALTDRSWEVPTGHYEQENMRETVVPNRNAIFASIAYAHALSVALRADSVCGLALGVHRGDHVIYPDCRPEFYDRLSEAFAVGNWDADRVTWYLPYLDWDKAAILRDAQMSCSQLDLEFETIFRNTCTSYQPDSSGRSPGLTGSDVERILAFHQLGIRDPLEYALPWEQTVEQALRLEAEFRNESVPLESDLPGA